MEARRQHKKLTIVILAICLIMQCFAAAAPASGREPDYAFHESGTRYSFLGWFHTTCDHDQLVRILFGYQHVKNYYRGAQAIELVNQGAGWNEVCFTHKKLFATVKSTYRKEMKDNSTIRFVMTSYQQEYALMLPRLLASQGHYAVRPESGGFRVEYYQDCQLQDKVFLKAYITAARLECIEFITDLSNYAEKMCR